MSTGPQSGIHRGALLWASFLTLIAAGMGFAIRGAILGDWASQFGFTQSQLGTITGGGLVGFGVIILISSLFVDKVGYKPILLVAFLLHVLSVVITLAATPMYNADDNTATYWCLYIGMFMFAVANGLCEAVINPLVATLYPRNKTHYLNLLHAGWPGGLIVGAIISYFFAGKTAAFMHLRWEIPIALFLVPTLIYGAMVLMYKFPRSEATEAGVTFAAMLKEFAAPLLLFLLVIHAMVGYVELGTDSWIQDIMKMVISGKAVLLFIYTSAIMFVLRFFAGPIVHKLNPIGLLFTCAILATAGLYMLGSFTSGAMIILAATIYGVGKTFFWPTMLGVASERFPKGGAVTLGVMGGIGMLSAGLLGGPIIGYQQDVYAAKQLKAESPALYAEYKAAEPSRVLFLAPVDGLDGKKVGEVKDVAVADRTPQEQEVLDASMFGGQMALKLTAIVPAMMAVCYLILVIYFRMKGGYTQEVLHGAESEEEKYTGGVEGPVE